MHQRSRSRLQGVSARRTTQNGALGSSRSRRRSGRLRLCAERGAPLWVWLLLGSLTVPGAWSVLSEEQEELLVELHNHYRGQVSPRAAAMMPLKWDATLKLTAEGYAAKCIWNHNPELEDTGENLFVGTGPLDLAGALEKWFLEHLDYDFQNNSCDEDKMCGHYTQMVWADTHKVGCAFHICSTMEGLGWEKVSFLVCNYFPAGNYEGERPYVEGDWCSACPENLQKCENNLCDAGTEEEEDEAEEEVGTAAPPPVTDKPSVQPEDEEQVVPDEEHVVPEVRPPTTAAPSVSSVSSVSTTAIPKSTPQAEDDVPAATPTVDTRPSTTRREEDEVETRKEVETEETRKEEETREEEETEETRKEEETREETDGGTKVDVAQILHQNSASALSPSLLSAALTAVLVLRP